ncbi:MAG TPA: hypothetical protein VHC41_00645 [Mycobacteriales bacterium]|nr:hypothetical protein [Mycobacteriales bacterium]
MTWSSAETGVLARAVSQAPSVHNLSPWTAEIRPSGAELYERFGVTLPRHDPTGRDRVISCGAALANLELGLRTLGWEPETELLPEDAHPDLLARVTSSRRHEATADEIACYSAIFRRRSYRAPFATQLVADDDLRSLTAGTDGVQARIIDRAAETGPLAELLSHAAQILRGDRAYQRELRAWSSQFPEPPAEESTLPWTGLVTARTHLPDTVTLARRLARESILVLLTVDDSRGDHVLAGRAMELIWLAAVAHGLAGSVLTQPLHLREIRAGLIEELDLPGFPQAILRLGHPVIAAPPAFSAAIPHDRRRSS